MKKLFCLFLGVSLLTMSGCFLAPNRPAANEPTTATPRTTIVTTTVEETTIALNTAVANRVSMNMTVEQLLEMFEENNIVIFGPEHPPSYDGEIVEDGRTYNFDGSFHFRTDSVEASFYVNGTLRSFYVVSDRFATTQGISVGDSRERMLQVYGQDFIPDTFGYDEIMFFHYRQGDHYLVFHIRSNIIVSWGLTTRIAGYA